MEEKDTEKAKPVSNKKNYLKYLGIGAACTLVGALAISQFGQSSGQVQGYLKETNINQNILDEEQKAAFQFMWDNTNFDKDSKGYGLVKDRATNDKMASIASVGFMLTGYGIGVENGWISKDQGYEAALGTLNTLYNNADEVEGFFYHFMDMDTAKRYAQVEVSVIDTAIAINGALFAGEYFGGEVKELATKIYERVNWDWYRNPKTNRFYMSYTPEKGEHDGAWGVYAEQLMLYFLGAGSPTHPVPTDMIYDIDRESVTWAGMQPYVASPANSLFTYQFSHAWFDMENLVDNKGYDWYNNSVVATLASRQFSIDTREIFKTHGANSWGLTACDGPFGYSGHYGANPNNPNDGTIPPGGAGGSAAFTPELVAQAFENYKTIDGLWDENWGFKDAYNSEGVRTFVVEDYLSIDKGITMVMIENQKSELVWDTMNKNEFVQEGMKKAGFMKADTRIIADADEIDNTKELKDDTVTISKVDDASNGKNAFEFKFDSSKSHDVELNLKSMKLEEAIMDAVRLDVKGKAEVSVSVYDRKGNELGKSATVSVDSSDAYETVTLEVDGMKEYPKDVKKVVLHIENKEETLLVDEICFASTDSMVRNVNISERPYVGVELLAYFDYINVGDDKAEDEQLFAYQWMIADNMKDEFKPIEGATQPTYKPTAKDVDKYLQVQITPVDENGNPTGKSAMSGAISKVSESMPLVSEDMKQTILERKGRVPDFIDGDTFSILDYWVDGGEGVYEIGDAGEKLIVRFTKEDKEYPHMLRNITVSDISKFQKLAFNIKNDTPILIKLEGKGGKNIGEVKIEPNGEHTYYEWDLSQHKEDLKNVWSILIFGLPGEKSGTGLFEFDKFEFSVEKATENVIFSQGVNDKPTNMYDGKSSIFDFNHYWADGGDKVYQITEDGKGNVIFNYNKNGAPTWALAMSKVGGDLTGFKKIVFELTGPKGAQILAKAEGAGGSSETGILTLDGTRQSVEIDLTTLTKAQLSQIEKILLFMEPNESVGAGTLTIHKAYFSKEAYTGGTLAHNVHVYSGDKLDFDVNKYWYDHGDLVYNIAKKGNTTVVDFKKGKGNEYSCMESNIKGNFSDFDYLNIEIKGKAGQQILFKLEGTKFVQEQFVVMDGTTQKISIRLDKTQNANTIKQVLAFALPGETKGSGHFEISRMYFSKDSKGETEVIHEYNGNKQDFHIMNGWINSLDQAYSFKDSGSSTVVNYNKAAGQEWAYFFANVKGNFNDFDYLYVDLKGKAGDQLLVKLQSDSYAFEHKINYSGDRQLVAIPLKDEAGLNTIKQLIMFANPNLTGKGNFELFDLYFSNTAPTVETVNKYPGDLKDFSFNNFWESNDAGIYTFKYENGSTVVTANKTDGWQFFYSPVEGRFSDFKYMNVTVKGTAGEQILFKLGDKEYWSPELTGESDTFQFDITNCTSLDELSQVLVFLKPGDAASTTVTIEDAHFTNTKSEDVPEEQVNVYNGTDETFAFNKYWTSNDKGIYNFETVNDSTVVSGNKTDGWQFFYSPVRGDFSNFKYMNITVKGTAGKQLLFKLGNTEYWSPELTGGSDTFQFDITNCLDLAILDKVLVFANPNETGEVSLTIEDTHFTNEKIEEPVTPPTEEESFLDKFNLGTFGLYTVAETENGVTVTINNKTNAGDWASYNTLIAGTKTYKYVNLVLKGEAGHEVILKTDKEYRFTMTGEEQIVQLPYADNLMVLMLPEATGTSTIEFTQANYTDEELSFLNKFETGTFGLYTVASLENGVSIAINNKTNAGDWASLNFPISGTALPYQYVNFVLKGEAGHEVILKTDKEYRFTMTGEEQTVQLPYADNLMVLMLPEATGSSKIEFSKAYYTNEKYEEPVTPPTEDLSFLDKFVDEVKGDYTVTTTETGKLVVANKPNADYSGLILNISGTEVSYQYLNLTVKGEAGHEVIFKTNGETRITFTGEEQTIQIPYSNELIIMMLPGAAGTSTMEIREAYYTNTKK